MEPIYFGVAKKSRVELVSSTPGWLLKFLKIHEVYVRLKQIVETDHRIELNQQLNCVLHVECRMVFIDSRKHRFFILCQISINKYDVNIF